MADKGNSEHEFQYVATESSGIRRVVKRKRPPVLEPGTELYRHFDAWGRLLYVGVSMATYRRLKGHRHSEWFCLIDTIKIERWPTRRSAMRAERQAVQNERPFFNITHSAYGLPREWIRPDKPHRHAAYCGDKSCTGCHEKDEDDEFSVVEAN